MREEIENCLAETSNQMWTQWNRVNVAFTQRVAERTRRPNLELCRDPAQLMLVSEVKQLQATLASLRQRLDEEQHQLQKLVTARSNIEHEIRTKANSIFIDQDKCMSMRKTFPTTPRLSGYSY